MLDSLAVWRVGFRTDGPGLLFVRCLKKGGESVLVNGAVFKTVSETVRTGSGRFDSYTPPPRGLSIAECRLAIDRSG
jgi:hypothetical protein